MAKSAHNDSVYPRNEDVANASKTKELVCEHCHERFKRREHLERHLHRHSRSRPFKCNVCSKSFSRKDTLKRHVATHGADAARALTISLAQESKRNARACVKCSNSKQKCDGNLPCYRCERKGRACVYTAPGATRSHYSSSASNLWSPQQELALASNQTFGTVTQALEPLLDINGSEELSPGTSDGSSAPSHQPLIGINNILDSPQLGTFENLNYSFSSNSNAIGLVPPLWIPDYYDFNVADPGAFTNPLDPGNLDSSLVYSNITLPQEPNYPLDIRHNYSEADIFAESAGLGTVANTTASRQACCEANNGGLYAHEGSIHLSRPRYTDSSAEDDDIISAEHFYHVPGVSEAAYETTAMLWKRYCGDTFIADPFPNLRQLNVFIQLYFEYFHPQTPIIHVPTFEPDKAPWMLLTAVAAIGCHYSTMSKIQRLTNSLYGVLRNALSEQVCKLISKIYMPMLRLEEQVKNVTNCDVPTTQSIFLCSICMLLRGSKEDLMHFQCQRSFLITMCRPFIARHGSLFTNSNDDSHCNDQNSWQAWIEDESMRRLIYAVWFLDCCNLVFFNVPVAMSMSELNVRLPSKDELWNCLNFESWVSEMNRRGNTNAPSLQELFTGHEFNLASFEGYTRSIVLISTYIEERNYLTMAISRLYRHMNHNLIQSAAALQPGTTSPEHGVPLRLLDAEFETFGLEASSFGEEKGSALSFRRFYHLLSILRHVSLRTLYAATKWHTSQDASKLALQELSMWIDEDGKNARSTVVHAARLFGDIRTQGIVSHHDPLCFLVATLVIWIYTGHAYQSGCVHFEATQPIRIDRLQRDLDVKDWIVQGQHKALHITGIGLLSECTSASLTLKEAIRILKSQRTWSGISHRLAEVMTDMLDGLDLAL